MQQALQHCAIGASTYGLGRDQTGRLQLPRLNLLARLVKPVTHQVRPARHTTRKNCVERSKVIVSQFPTFFAAPQKRRIPNHHIGLGPRRLHRFSGFNKRQQRIAALNMLQRFQNRVAFELVAVRHTPLQLANPDCYARQLGGVAVELNPQHVVRPGNQIGLAVQPQR
ncbi:MAG: hypothetical protein CO105_09550 [Comamonadaceae bacterium CG_4_9_14_3_um_filter_60_33]|nr:MAG: hypothetical protein CO105_09550 [Comamonadaceae bacterium CG_4_9_14_3_um_filter_60_33]